MKRSDEKRRIREKVGRIALEQGTDALLSEDAQKLAARYGKLEDEAEVMKRIRKQASVMNRRNAILEKAERTGKRDTRPERILNFHDRLDEEIMAIQSAPDRRITKDGRQKKDAYLGKRFKKAEETCDSKNMKLLNEASTDWKARYESLEESMKSREKWFEDSINELTEQIKILKEGN